MLAEYLKSRLGEFSHRRRNTGGFVGRLRNTLMGYHTQGHVFVSYCHKDETLVRPIVRKVEEMGAECWIDEGNLDYGPGWKRQVQDAVAKAIGALIFVGPGGLGSVQADEIHAIYERRKEPEVDLPAVYVYLAGAHWNEIPPEPLTGEWQRETIAHERDVKLEGLFRKLTGLEPLRPLPSTMRLPAQDSEGMRFALRSVQSFVARGRVVFLLGPEFATPEAPYVAGLLQRLLADSGLTDAFGKLQCSEAAAIQGDDVDQAISEVIFANSRRRCAAIDKLAELLATISKSEPRSQKPLIMTTRHDPHIEVALWRKRIPFVRLVNVRTPHGLELRRQEFPAYEKGEPVVLLGTSQGGAQVRRRVPDALDEDSMRDVFGILREWPYEKYGLHEACDCPVQPDGKAVVLYKLAGSAEIYESCLLSSEDLSRYREESATLMPRTLVTWLSAQPATIAMLYSALDADLRFVRHVVLRHSMGQRYLIRKGSREHCYLESNAWDRIRLQVQLASNMSLVQYDEAEFLAALDQAIRPLIAAGGRSGG